MSENWIRVAAVDEVDEDDLIQVEVGKELIALFNLAGEYFASSDICTHEYACLSDGFVIDGLIECPLHQGCFDIKSGKAKGAPVTVDLTTYQTKVIEKDIYILLVQPE